LPRSLKSNASMDRLFYVRFRPDLALSALLPFQVRSSLLRPPQSRFNSLLISSTQLSLRYNCFSFLYAQSVIPLRKHACSRRSLEGFAAGFTPDVSNLFAAAGPRNLFSLRALLIACCLIPSSGSSLRSPKKVSDDALLSPFLVPA